MPNSQIFILLVLATMTACFVHGRLRYDVIGLAGLLSLAMTGLIPAKEVFVGLGHPAVLTVAGVLVLSKGLQNCGAVNLIAQKLGSLGWRPSFQVALLVVLVTALSAFINNVGALALLLPVGFRLAQKNQMATSSFLMSLSFGSILGGLFCLISTPVNLLVSDFRAHATGKGFAFFDFTPVGSVLIVVGLAYMLLASRWLLPQRPNVDDSGGMLNLTEYTSELKIGESSHLVGKSLAELPALEDYGILVVSIVSPGEKPRRPSSRSALRQDDHLVIQCLPEDLGPFLETTQTTLASKPGDTQTDKPAGDDDIIEAVVSPGSRLIDRTAKTSELRSKHGLNLMGVARQGARVRTRLANTPFRTGDVLLLQANNSVFNQSAEELGLLRLASRVLLPAAPRRSVVFGVTIFVLSIVTAALGILPVEQAFILGALVMVVSGTLTAQEAYDSMEISVLVLLACMIPIGHALETSGASTSLAQWLISHSRSLSDQAILGLFMAVTVLCANLMNNKAATAIMAPIAISLAQELKWSPDPLLMGVAVGAEFVFLSPIGHQCNLLILGAGSYNFSDFLKFGTPLVILGLAISVFAIPYFWPLHP